METTNQERVTRAFTILVQHIKPQVVTALQKVDGPAYEGRLRDTLRKDESYYINRSQSPTLDAAALLLVIWQRWQDFASYYNFEYEQKRYISELRDARNKWAHQNDFNDDAAARVIDTVRLLTKSFDGVNVQELTELHREIVLSTYAAQVTTPKISVQPQRKPARQKEIDGDTETSGNFHAECVERVSKHLGKELVRRRGTTYSTRDGSCRLVCSASKIYNDGGKRHYWFAFRRQQWSFLEAGAELFVAYGCGSADNMLLIPIADYMPLVEQMNVTDRGETYYWHVHIYEEESKLVLKLKNGRGVDVSKFLLKRDR